MMRPLILLAGLILSGCRAHEPLIEASALRPLTDRDTRLIRITEEDHYRPGASGSRLIAEVRGASPANREWIDRLWAEHQASFPAHQRDYYGQDASYTQIEFIRGPDRIVARSWHTVERRSPHIFASHRGLELLGDRNREAALATEPGAYRRFRASFDAITEAVGKRKK